MAEQTSIDKKFLDSMGLDAKVERHTIESELAERQQQVFRNIGEELNPHPEFAKHMGSFAIHIYQTEGTKTLLFMKQLIIEGLEEVVAGKAFEDLKQTVMESYGHKRQTKRSGF